MKVRYNLYKSDAPIHIEGGDKSITIAANEGKKLTIVTDGIDFHHQLIIMNFAQWYFGLDSVPKPLIDDEIIMRWTNDFTIVQLESFNDGRLTHTDFFSREKMERIILSSAMENYAYTMFEPSYQPPNENSHKPSNMKHLRTYEAHSNSHQEECIDWSKQLIKLLTAFGYTIDMYRNTILGYESIIDEMDDISRNSKVNLFQKLSNEVENLIAKIWAIKDYINGA